MDPPPEERLSRRELARSLSDHELLDAINHDWAPMYRNVWYGIAALFAIMFLAFLVRLWIGVIPFLITLLVAFLFFMMFLGRAMIHLVRWSLLWPELNRRRKLARRQGQRR